MVGLQHLHSCGIDGFLEGQFQVVLAVETGRRTTEPWRGAATLLPPASVSAEHSRLGEVSWAGIDIRHSRQIPHGIGHAVLAAIVRSEVQDLFAILLDLNGDRQRRTLAQLHRPPATQCLAPCPAPGAPPKTDIVKHAQKG